MFEKFGLYLTETYYLNQIPSTDSLILVLQEGA